MIALRVPKSVDEITVQPDHKRSAFNGDEIDGDYSGGAPEASTRRVDSTLRDQFMYPDSTYPNGQRERSPDWQ